MKRFVVLFLVLIIAVTAIPVSVFAEETKKIAQYRYDFEKMTPAEDWNDDTSGINISFMNGKWRATDKTVGINKQSLQVQQADFRWWNVDYTGKVMGFSLDVRVGKNFDNRLVFNISNHDSSTSTESADGGRIFVVEKEQDKVVLKNYDLEVLTELEEGKAYTLGATFNRGEKTYTITVNEKSYEGNNFVSGVYAVQGMRLSVAANQEGAFVTVDNLEAYTLGRENPQENSYQEVGEIPEVELPNLDETSVFAYVNKTQIDLSKKEAKVSDGTVYLPVEETFKAAGVQYDKISNGEISINCDGVVATISKNLKTVKYGDKYISLNHHVKMVWGTLYAPLQVFAELLDAKVWYNESAKIVTITNGEYLNDNILRLFRGRFYMNGEPYYEISFNKFDLNRQIAADAEFNDGEFTNRVYSDAASCIAGAETALKQLSENGFKTIRVFCSNINPQKSEEELEKFWRQADMMFDMCDKYGISVVCCLSLYTNEFLDGKYDGELWVTKDEELVDYITDENSQSRKNAVEFLETYINRYKDRDTVLMWEITNEGNLEIDVGSGTSVKFSLLQLSEFYADMASVIKSCDGERLITGGDSMLRSAQWNLFSSVMRGESPDWSVDTAEERKMALALLNKGLDVISVHGYDVGYESNTTHGKYIVTEKRKEVEKFCTFELFLEEAYSLGKGLYAGEVGGLMGYECENTSRIAAEKRTEYLQTIVDAGVQLTHWWTFRSDRKGGGFNNDLDMWNVTIEDTPETFEAIKNANALLKEKWLVNGATEENTENIASGNFALGEEKASLGERLGCKSAFSGSVSFVIIGLGCLWLILSQKEASRKRP